MEIYKIISNLSINYKSILNNLSINYKSFLLYILCSVILCDGNIIKGILCFGYSYAIICYGVHLCAHIDCLYCTPQAIIHFKHHENSESMLYFVLECIIEYFGFVSDDN